MDKNSTSLGNTLKKTRTESDKWDGTKILMGHAGILMGRLGMSWDRTGCPRMVLGCPGTAWKAWDCYGIRWDGLELGTRIGMGLGRD